MPFNTRINANKGKREFTLIDQGIFVLICVLSRWEYDAGFICVGGEVEGCSGV